jgi:tetratricopeptide (TPR) repeat protein
VGVRLHAVRRRDWLDDVLQVPNRPHKTSHGSSDVAMNDWEQRSSALWAAIDDFEPEAFRARIDELTAELPPQSAIALFERACANDSTGRADHAVPLYRQALAAGLTGERRRRAVIQLASSLRNLGQTDESVRLLTAEREHTSDDLDDAVTAFLALALVDSGREREAAALALRALARHLPRYNRSLANYAEDLA